VLLAVANAWRERREDLVTQAQRLVEALGHSARIEPSAEPLTATLLEEAEAAIGRTFEPAYGGFGHAPKFPPSPALEFLLRRESAHAREMVTRTLDGMSAGGMYDVVGGGFHRYSVDAQWLVPHFEKMLYDNALLASTYLHAWVVTGTERYRSVVEQTLDYVLRELRLPDGGLASAQDADTDGVEGLTYTWPPAEAAEVGLPPGVLVPWEDGRAIVRGELGEDVRARALHKRNGRAQPFRDDKVIASWNGLALAALAEAGYRLDRADWLDAARGVAGFLLGPLSSEDGGLRRSWRDGRTSGEAFLDDYANASFGLLELHVATGEPRWLAEARRLALLAVERFLDEERGGFFLSAHGAERLAARAKDLDDNPLPSGNSMLAWVLLRLARLWADDGLEARALSVLRLVAPALSRVPGGFGWALCALDLHLAPPRELAVVGDVQAPVARAALRPFQPRTVAAVGPAEDVPLLAGKTLVRGRTAVYACERFACLAPVTDPADVEVA
jgi:uncharacterized protein YyaL (SSP411 family)